jgi:AcrR family transcriptional regulator
MAIATDRARSVRARRRSGGAAAPPRTRNPEATRADILTAAQAMLAERGPHALTVSDVARRARVNRGTAYQHFRTRAGLIAAVLERLGRTTKTVLDAGAPPTLNDRIDATVEYFVEHPELVRLSLFRMLAGIPHPNEALWKDYVKRMRRLAADGRGGIDSEMLAVILLGATLLWSLRVQSGAASASANRRYLRELKRLMLYGAVRPERHADLVAAVHGPAHSPVHVRRAAGHENRRTG